MVAWLRCGWLGSVCPRWRVRPEKPEPPGPPQLAQADSLAACDPQQQSVSFRATCALFRRCCTCASGSLRKKIFFLLGIRCFPPQIIGGELIHLLLFHVPVPCLSPPFSLSLSDRTFNIIICTFSFVHQSALLL